MTISTPVTANNRSYPAPKTTAIVICLDGCEPDYLDVAIAAGLMPTLARMRREGTDRLAHSVIPSFTNPNNLSIATGTPPAVHGICGNYLFDPETGTEVMMNDVRFLRAPTIFKQFYDAGAKVAVVTAKDKLRALLGAGPRRPNTGWMRPPDGLASRSPRFIRQSFRNLFLPRVSSCWKNGSPM